MFVATQEAVDTPYPSHRNAACKIAFGKLDRAIRLARHMFFVRIAKAADVPKIARMRVDTLAGPVSSALLKARSVKRREAFWHGRFEQARGSIFLIESDEIVGFCDLVPSLDKGADPKTIGEIAALSVLADSWRQGAGRALVSFVLSEARKRGYKAVTVWVLASNSDAMRFYESMGFARDGTFKIETAPDGSSLHELRYRIKI